jgi:hypothetical protein
MPWSRVRDGVSEAQLSDGEPFAPQPGKPAIVGKQGPPLIGHPSRELIDNDRHQPGSRPRGGGSASRGRDGCGGRVAARQNAKD